MGSATVKVVPWPRPSLSTRDGAAVQLDELLHDGEAQPEPAVAARGGGVGLPEAVEHVGQELGGDPCAACRVTRTCALRVSRAPAPPATRPSRG